MAEDYAVHVTHLSRARSPWGVITTRVIHLSSASEFAEVSDVRREEGFVPNWLCTCLSRVPKCRLPARQAREDPSRPRFRASAHSSLTHPRPSSSPLSSTPISASVILTRSETAIATAVLNGRASPHSDSSLLVSCAIRSQLPASHHIAFSLFTIWDRLTDLSPFQRWLRQ